MTINEHDLQKIINEAWKAAEKKHKPGAQNTEQTQEDTNKEKSVAWVNELAKRIQHRYPAVDHRVFWRQNEENRSCFLLSEFLFDVTVAQIKCVDSLQKGKNRRKVPVIVRCKWIVESEFNTGNLKEILKDASKLVVADAENKLLVIARRDECTKRKLQDRLASLASECSGNLFLAFVEHPNKWNNCSERPLLLKWDKGRFREVT